MDRSRYAEGVFGAGAGDIRKMTDEKENRLWSVTDRPVPGNRAHAEIQYEPRGKTPGRAGSHRTGDRGGTTSGVASCKSAAEAVRAYVGVGIVTEADATEEWRRLERKSM